MKQRHWRSSGRCDYEKCIKTGCYACFQPEFEKKKNMDRGFFVHQTEVNMTGRDIKTERKGVIKHLWSSAVHLFRAGWVSHR